MGYSSEVSRIYTLFWFMLRIEQSRYDKIVPVPLGVRFKTYRKFRDSTD